MDKLPKWMKTFNVTKKSRLLLDVTDVVFGRENLRVIKYIIYIGRHFRWRAFTF